MLVSSKFLTVGRRLNSENKIRYYTLTKPPTDVWGWRVVPDNWSVDLTIPPTMAGESVNSGFNTFSTENYTTFSDPLGLCLFTGLAPVSGDSLILHDNITGVVTTHPELNRWYYLIDSATDTQAEVPAGTSGGIPVTGQFEYLFVQLDQLRVLNGEPLYVQGSRLNGDSECEAVYQAKPLAFLNYVTGLYRKMLQTECDPPADLKCGCECKSKCNCSYIPGTQIVPDCGCSMCDPDCCDENSTLIDCENINRQFAEHELNFCDTCCRKNYFYTGLSKEPCSSAPQPCPTPVSSKKSSTEVTFWILLAVGLFVIILMLYFMYFRKTHKI